MAKEPSIGAQTDRSDDMTVISWEKSGFRFIIKRYSNGKKIYAITFLSTYDRIFTAEDRGWLHGTHGSMEVGLSPDVLIMKMLSQ